MNIASPPESPGIPDPVRETLEEFRKELDLELHLWAVEGDERVHVYPDGFSMDGSEDEEGASEAENGRPGAVPGAEPGAVPGASPGAALPRGIVRSLTPREGPALELELRGIGGREGERMANVLHQALARSFDFAQEIRFFTYELSERYEEINLLYSISETLGSILRLDDAARVILGEVSDVLGARRGSLWVHDSEDDELRLTASVGEDGALTGPLPVDHADAVTSLVFREGRSLITHGADAEGRTLHGVEVGDETDSFLSVPIRYTPPAGEPRTVGVINLIGRRHGGRFTASDQKLLSAIASQVGAALENNRLIQESLERERVAREMELAHNLQMKLLPSVEKIVGDRAAARVEPAESVGGDFYHLIRLSEDKLGVMIGDVSSHGFPAALIMALSISAATIYASEFTSPAKVLRSLDDALRDELETTEMYLTLFYGVLDPSRGTLTYSNAGHPHAFLIDPAGKATRMDATDPPVGIAGPDSYGEQECEWAQGEDLIFLFTDGLSDTLSSDETGSGEELILRKVRDNLHLDLPDLLAMVFELTIAATPKIPSDDRTALVLRM